VCRACGEVFVGREGWRPICSTCWRRARARHLADEAVEPREFAGRRGVSREQ
jgi:hypothetical protein